MEQPITNQEPTMTVSEKAARIRRIIRVLMDRGYTYTAAADQISTDLGVPRQSIDDCALCNL